MGEISRVQTTLARFMPGRPAGELGSLTSMIVPGRIRAEACKQAPPRLMLRVVPWRMESRSFIILAGDGSLTIRYPAGALTGNLLYLRRSLPAGSPFLGISSRL